METGREQYKKVLEMAFTAQVLTRHLSRFGCWGAGIEVCGMLSWPR
jgi:hypothetical protein